MPYEKARELADVSYQKWVSEELFSFGWFVMLSVLLIAYIVWLIILDKNKVIYLLLIGSLSAVGFLISDIILYGFYGFVEYPIALTPFKPSLFVVNVTLAPIVIMIAEQYGRSWKGYIVRAAVGMGLLAFALLPVYSLLGIVKYHNGWNYIHHFLSLFGGAMLVRIVFLWLHGMQKRHPMPKTQTE